MTYRVVDHYLDTVAGTYRLVVGVEREGALEEAEDFVFVADDERWDGMSAEEVAAAQRKEVKSAITKRAKEAEAEARKRAAGRKELPGVDEAL